MKKLPVIILALSLLTFFSVPIVVKAESCHLVTIPNTCTITETQNTLASCSATLSKADICCCTANSPALSADKQTPKNKVVTPSANTAKTNAPTDNTKIYNSLNFEPQVQIPNSIFDKKSVAVGHYDAGSGKMYSSLLAEYIKALYNYGLIIGSILAAVVLMGGGMLWLVSAGNDSRISQAKELITGSIVGLVILFSSWLILTTINPNLVKLKILETQVIPKSSLAQGCCTNKITHKVYNDTKGECGTNKFQAELVANLTTNECEVKMINATDQPMMVTQFNFSR